MPAPKAEEIRLGLLAFLNAYPVYAGLSLLESHHDRYRFEFVGGLGHPVALNRMLEEGEIDVSPGSAAAVAGRTDRYLPVPGLSISSEGPVGSVILFSRVPVGELAGRSVALPDNSATSVALLGVLCRHHWRTRPRFVSYQGQPSLGGMLAAADAALIIGDEALKARIQGIGLEQIDLGEAWYEFSGLPMVFALWAFRTEWADAHPEAFDWACRRLVEAGRTGREVLEEDIPILADTHKVPAPFLREYYSCLDYRFEESHRRGLALFLNLASQLDEAGSPEVVKDER